MATIKQINANKKNALLSKGHKTDLGKLNSSLNLCGSWKLKSELFINPICSLKIFIWILVDGYLDSLKRWYIIDRIPSSLE